MEKLKENNILRYFFAFSFVFMVGSLSLLYYYSSNYQVFWVEPTKFIVMSIISALACAWSGHVYLSENNNRKENLFVVMVFIAKAAVGLLLLGGLSLLFQFLTLDLSGIGTF